MNSFRLATWNINGLSPNKSELELLMQTHLLDAVLVSEAHCTVKSNIKIAGCSIYTTNHPDGTGHAGTAVIIRNTVKHHLLPEFKSEYLQATTVAIRDSCGYFNISAVYCPPKYKISEEMFSSYFNTLGNRFISGGDWNSKHISWGSRLTTTRGRQLRASADINHLNVLTSQEPTSWPSDPTKVPDLIDFFLTKGMSRIYCKVESCMDGSSDHTPVLLTVSQMLIECEKVEKLCNQNTDWDAFRDYLDSRIDLQASLKSHKDIEEAAMYITNRIQQACWSTTPTERERNHITNMPLFIKTKILEKRKLRRQWHESRLKEDKTILNRAIVELKSLIQNWKDTTLQTKLESLTATASTGYSLWKFTKSYERPQEAKPPLKRPGGGWARTSHEKANAFAEHLAKVFTTNDTHNDHNNENKVKSILYEPYQMSVPPTPTTVREVWRTIKHLKDKKAPGFDLITKEILVQLPRRAVVFLTTLYNGILRTQCFPLVWKVSRIIMIHKAGKPPNDVSSYRPISLLPILSKICEKILLRRISPILTETKAIPDHQFGFRQKHSTVEQVHRVCNVIMDTLERKEYCSSAFLDIQQAFDRVWHEGLLSKLKNVLPHSFHPLLSSYLTDRIFQVAESGETSNFYRIQAGVPQGSVLGPVLYTIFTADLPRVPGVTTATFADDTALLASDVNPQRASLTLQRGLDEISKWLCEWKIKASATKSAHVTFTLRKGDCPPVQLGGSTLPHKNEVRYLGLHLDRRLTWKEHIRNKRDELNIKFKTLLWLLGRNSKLSTDNKLLIYKAVLKPVWLYGIQLWGSASNSNISVLQRSQNAILRTIANGPWFTTNNEIHEELDMNTVKEEIRLVSSRYHQRLKVHPNELATILANPRSAKRLKRFHISDLQTRM